MIKLYENIKNRRIELNMSQTELAQRVGYKDKGSISRIENGKIDLTQSMIESFAKALDCSPAYLMGWTNEPKIDKKKLKHSLALAIEKMQKELSDIKEYEETLDLSVDEKFLIECYRKVNKDSKRRITKYIQMEMNDD